MKSLNALVCAGILGVGTFTAAHADSNSDNAKWVAQCISDNKDEGQTIETITSYCNCMNDKMSDDETKSISEWEKAHPSEEDACAKTAHWANK